MIPKPVRAQIDKTRQAVWRDVFERLRIFELTDSQYGEIATETAMTLDRLLVAALDTEPIPTDQPRSRLRRHTPSLPTQEDLDALYDAAAEAGENEEIEQPTQGE